MRILNTSKILLVKILLSLHNKYFIYHLRWQLSAWVMFPLMLFFESFSMPLWLNLMIGQFFGALVFWHVDKRIFKENTKKNNG